MNYLDLTIKEIHVALLNKKVTPVDLVKEAIKRAKENKDNAFELIIEEDAIKKAEELSKLDKANKLGVKVINEEEFKELLGGEKDEDNQ